MRLRKPFAVLIALIIALTCSACGSANIDDNITNTLGSEYTVITKDTIDDNAQAIEKLGFTVKNFKTLFENNSLALFAVNVSTNTQLQLKVTDTDFSQQIGDFSLFDDNNLADIAKEIAPEYTGLYSVKDIYYIRTQSTVESDNGNYSTVQYITVKNGILYTLSIYANENTTIDEQSILTSINIDTQKTGASENATFYLSLIMIIIFVLLFVAASVYIVVTTVIQIKNNREQNDVREYVRIKRRKF